MDKNQVGLSQWKYQDPIRKDSKLDEDVITIKNNKHSYKILKMNKVHTRYKNWIELLRKDTSISGHNP